MGMRTRKRLVSGSTLRMLLAVFVHAALTLGAFYWVAGWTMTVLDTLPVTEAPLGLVLLTWVFQILAFPFLWLLKSLLGGWVREGGLSFWEAMTITVIINSILVVTSTRFLWRYLKNRRGLETSTEQ